jgi:hypothetical protein
MEEHGNWTIPPFPAISSTSHKIFAEGFVSLRHGFPWRGGGDVIDYGFHPLICE